MNTIRRNHSCVVTVVLSEKEQAVIDRILKELQTADEMEEDVTRLKSEYPKSQERFENMRRKQIETVADQINMAFDALSTALDVRRQRLLLELQEMRHSDNGDAEHIDELLVCTENIGDLRTFLRQKEREYNNTISMKRNNAERQSEILQIGRAVDMEVSEIKKWIGESTKSVRAEMCKQSETAFIMDFTMTDGAYDRMMVEIGRLGRVTSAVKIMSGAQFIGKTERSQF